MTVIESDNHVVITIPTHSVARLPILYREAIAHSLKCPEISFSRDNNRVSSCKVVTNLYEIDGEELLIPTGSIGRIMKILEDAGFQVDVHDARNYLPENLEIAASLPGLRDELAEKLQNALKSHHAGCFHAARGNRRWDMIGRICNLLPEAKIFVVTSTKKRAFDGMRAIATYVGGAVDAVHTLHGESSCRVVCGTHTTFLATDPSQWHTIIFEEAFDVNQKTVQLGRRPFREHRVYGFVDPKTRLSTREQYLLEMWIGPVIASRDHSDAKPTIQFAVQREVKRAEAASAAEHYRMIAVDNIRNQAIAGIASAFATRDRGKLHAYGLLCDDNSPFDRWQHGPSVSVLVETASHASALRRVLPDFELLHSMSRRHGQVREWSDWILPSRTIVTTLRAEKYPTFDADVIINASGGSTPQIPKQLRHPSNTLIVDFSDIGNSQLLRDQQSRRKWYTVNRYSFAQELSAPSPIAPHITE